MLQVMALLLVAQVQVPPPRGYVNDFAVVTLPDIDDRSAADVALQIGRQWRV